MKTIRSTRFLMTGLFAAIVVLATLSFPGHSEAAAVKEIILHSGVIGITQGQTARLTLVNWENQSIPVALQLLDVNGKVLAETTTELAPGQSISIEANGDNLVPEPPTRLELRAQVIITYPRDPCDIPSLEVYDNVTGKTTVIVTDFSRHQ
ncbi:MAG: hypothetical protein L0287_02515 [Anaerolineae bacterium]|nr:hypothetical protein [Anaerolineae bacterium]MCI0610755.1 hypothetical protein [Anaerolineae bacterium]